MLTDTTKRRIGKCYTAFVMSSLALAAIGFVYGFQVGVIEAGWGFPRMPFRYIEAYCWPAHMVEQIPLVGIYVRLADEMGYQFAGGPETTR